MTDTTFTAGGGQGFPADNPDGTPGLIGKDDYTRQEAIAKLTRKPQTVLAGNFADLQRLGADAAKGTINVQSAVATPPGIDAKDKNVVTPAESEAARGEFTRETSRTGLVDAPIAPTPDENKSPNVVDPTSQSPVAESSSTPKSATKQ